MENEYDSERAELRYCVICRSRFFCSVDDLMANQPVCSYCAPHSFACANCGKLTTGKKIITREGKMCIKCKIESSPFYNPWLIARFKTFVRDNFQCRYCGRSTLTDEMLILECDHIKPRCHGGTDDLDNLVTSCRECNQGKFGFTLKTELAYAIRNRKPLDQDSQGKETDQVAGIEGA